MTFNLYQPATHQTQKMKTATIQFDNGNKLTTSINGTKAEIEKYYLGNTFNLGTGGNDQMAKAVSVEIESEHKATRVKSDVNGNPRYVVHFLAFITREKSDELDAIANERSKAGYITFGTTLKYEYALKLARRVGGRKFHNKQYGGGIVFQCCGQTEIDALIEQALALTPELLEQLEITLEIVTNE